jgi:outer membrane protein OmpA-like peptidoglycan-associated protein
MTITGGQTQAKRYMPRNLALQALSIICVCLLSSSQAVSQVKTADEIVNALKPKPLTRGLKVEDFPPLKIDLTINFEFNSAKLSSDAQAQLTELGTALSDPNLEELSFSVVGHTDGVGGDAYNLRLSKQRAESVVKYLNNRFSVKLNRLKPEGKGKTQMKIPDSPESSENRRVEISTLRNNQQ